MPKIPADQVSCPVCEFGGYEGQMPSGKTMITHPGRAFGCVLPTDYVRTQHSPDCAAMLSIVRNVDGVPVYRKPCNCGFRRSVHLQSLVANSLVDYHLDRFSEVENAPGKNFPTVFGGS